MYVCMYVLCMYVYVCMYALPYSCQKLCTLPDGIYSAFVCNRRNTLDPPDLDFSRWKGDKRVQGFLAMFDFTVLILLIYEVSHKCIYI